MRERDIEKKLVDETRKRGGRAIKLRGYTGIPDRMILLPGGIVGFVEVKKPGGKLSPAQVVWLRRLHKLGFAVDVCDAKEQVDSILNSITVPWASGQLEDLLEQFS